MAGVLHHVTCYEERFEQSMTCMCVVWEEYYERSGAVSTAGTHDSWGIEEQGSGVATLRAAEEAIITAEGSGKRRG